MVDTNKIAIADVLKHPKLGLVSHQPDIHEPISDTIRVRDFSGGLHSVLASECEWPSEQDGDYWKDNTWVRTLDHGA